VGENQLADSGALGDVPDLRDIGERGGHPFELGPAGAVPTAVSSHVVAIANFGDPGHVTGQSWDLGTATRNGLFPRGSAQLGRLSAFGGSGKIAAWCDANDPYCASGVNLEVHLTYLDRYQNAAASFVLGKIGG
jgi:hypothetical protein